MLIELLTIAATVSIGWLWSGSETPAGKHFLGNHEFIADETSTNFIEIDGVVLPKPIRCEGMFAWFNRVAHPSDKAMTEEQMIAAVEKVITLVKTGRWITGPVTKAHRLGTYQGQGRWEC